MRSMMPRPRWDRDIGVMVSRRDRDVRKNASIPSRDRDVPDRDYNPGRVGRIVYWPNSYAKIHRIQIIVAMWPLLTCSCIKPRKQTLTRGRHSKLLLFVCLSMGDSGLQVSREIITACRLVCLDKRTCLMAENVEGLVFLKANLNNFWH